MHARLEHAVARLGASRTALHEAVERVPEPLRNTRPGPDRWSTAEVLDHLVRVERSVAHLLSARITEGRLNGLGRETSNQPADDEALMARTRDRTMRLEAGASARPDPAATWTEALAALDETRASLLAAIEGGDGLALAELTFPHRAFGPLNFYEWMSFVAGHEERHAAQIVEISQALS